ncbi:permease-like cell division protein FtsX [Litorihabitans aurantiacus]|uniref:Cell division protein FtsX n=1 Tax=Litorihabitans aurantiacus TaxID=1930061 RepID=A0AA38CTN0_9MICO|nr:permease-like cell division protein FtsX [Litorihabitans aurantiacus]GMA32007.1 cell division protein FtsX [Litorihabitans aurantiacus]
MSRFRFVLGEIGQGLRRNLSMAVSVVLVTFVSLTFVGAAALLQMQIGKMQGEWYDRVEVSVFLCPSGTPRVETCAGGEATPEQIDEIRGVLEAPAMSAYIDEVFFETKEQAYEAVRDQAGDEDWFQLLSVDQMQASFRVALVDPTQIDIVMDEVAGRTGVEEVLDQREIFEPIFLVMNRATILSVGLAVVMTVTAVLLITTTIRLSAMSRRRETEIMRFVGASNFFIQLPFMLEGALAALLGAVLATGTLWFGVRYGVEDWLSSSVGFVTDYVSTAEVWLIAPVLAAIGIAIAAVSSLVSLSRYTKV